MLTLHSHLQSELPKVITGHHAAKIIEKIRTVS